MARVTTEQRKPTRVFFPTQRVLRGETAEKQAFRVVEGYCYVNAWVGDGINLLRSAMVAASDDYMRWGAVRQMHQPSAVGTAIGTVEVEGETLPLGVQWDDNGAFLRTLIVDTDAITKLDTGVYRGYSVCVVPTIMRGVDCEACKWIENSLVDRPFDPDCPLTLVRAENADVEAFQPVIRYWDENDNWVDGPFLFDARLTQLRKDDVLCDLREAHWMLLQSWDTLLVAGQTNDLATSLDQFVAYVKGDILGDLTTERSEQVKAAVKRMLSDRDRSEQEGGMLKRVQDGQTEAVRLRGELQQERAAVSTLTGERDTAQAEVKRLEAEVKRLSAEPDPKQQQPLRFATTERTFAANQGEQQGDTEADKLRAEFTQLQQTLPNEPDASKRQAGVMRMQTIKMELQRLTDAAGAAGGM